MATTSEFEDLCTAAGGLREHVLDVFARDVTYTPSGGAAGTVQAVVTWDDETVGEGEAGQDVARRGTLEVSEAAVATVTVGKDLVTVDKVACVVESVRGRGAGMVELGIVRASGHEASRPGWRNNVG